MTFYRKSSRDSRTNERVHMQPLFRNAWPHLTPRQIEERCRPPFDDHFRIKFILSNFMLA